MSSPILSKGMLVFVWLGSQFDLGDTASLAGTERGHLMTSWALSEEGQEMMNSRLLQPHWIQRSRRLSYGSEAIWTEVQQERIGQRKLDRPFSEGELYRDISLGFGRSESVTKWREKEVHPNLYLKVKITYRHTCINTRFFILKL